MHILQKANTQAANIFVSVAADGCFAVPVRWQCRADRPLYWTVRKAVLPGSGHILYDLKEVSMAKNIIIGQSGGPTAVINSSLAGVYKAARSLGADKVYGMKYGID